MLVVALPYVVIGREPDQIDITARSAAGAEFVRLSDGFAHYDLAGESSAELVVLVPGTTVPYFVWDRNVKPLADAGFRVLRYDLYGRGLSERISGPYDLSLFTRQLDELVRHVAPDERVTLVGVSLGGMIISEFARLHPDRVRALVLIDPAGVGTDLPLAAKAALAPGLGEYTMRVLGARQLRPARRMLLHPERYPEFDGQYLATLSIRGSRHAVLSTLRSVPFADYEEGFRAVAESDIPVLLIWGEQDRVVPFENHDTVRTLVGADRFLAVADAGHFPQFEQPERVNAEIVAFLRQVHR